METYTKHCLRGEAVGAKIAWPNDKIILDELSEPPNAANTNGSEDTTSSIGKVQIFDWNFDDVLVADGILCSTDPKELVNDIPLGPNAASVKIQNVVKDDAFLWRPSAEISVMGDALHFNIAWPVDKIRSPTIPSREDSATKSTQSGSQSTGSSNGWKHKCILLACDGNSE
ncbi:unnamed protein product [Microthlaspi erraticum]|uniref:Transposase Tnp1/En/Spm-like domain-containing protein n=1 Tax=Microthlaspi erraticum TaxID=1685480 RepID=A0A6D2IS04_9BRAS|nr:unnamed protein product [Microthlaspi erraticum]